MVLSFSALVTETDRLLAEKDGLQPEIAVAGAGPGVEEPDREPRLRHEISARPREKRN